MHKILIAEDNQVNYLYLETLLETIDQKYEVIRAKNGKEAVEITKKDKIDLVLMDLKMPILDGYEATKQIKKLYPGLSVIAQNAYSQDENIEKAKNAGCDEFLAKPVKKESIKNILKKHFIK